MATNSNPIYFVNPINLGGNEITNHLLEKLSTAPSSPVSGRVYYNTTTNKAMLYDGTTWVELSGNNVGIANVTVDTASPTLQAFIDNNLYNTANWNEGDVLVLTNASSPADRSFVNLGTNNGDATDFAALTDVYTEAEIHAMFGATGGLSYDNGYISFNPDGTSIGITVGGNVEVVDGGISTVKIADDAVTKAKIAADVAGSGLQQNADGSLEVKHDSSLGIVNGSLSFNPTVIGGFLAKNGLTYVSGHGIDVNVDGSTVEINGSDNLQVKDAGIVTAKIADDAVTKAKLGNDIAGDGLEQNSDGSLKVKVDGTTVTIVDGQLVSTATGSEVDYAALAGDGLTNSGSVLNVNADNSTVEVYGDAIRVKDGGITETQLDSSVGYKLNRNGASYSLADTGVTGVSYSNGVFTITHNFGTRDIACVMRDSSDNYRQIPCNNDANTINTVRVYFAEKPTNNQYKVSIIPMVF